MKKYILKNKNKYQKLNLNKGINLANFSSFKRATRFMNISMIDYNYLWFNLPKGEAIFKPFDSDYCAEVVDYRIINELLCSNLAKQLGLLCTETEIAHHNGQTGVVSYNVINNKTQKLMTGYEFLQNYASFDCCIGDFVNAIHNHNGYYIDKKQLIKDLYKIVLFDAITFQSDRHMENIHFVKDNSTKTIKVAPLIDNEFAFGGECIPEYLDNNFDFKTIDFVNDYSLVSKKLTVYKQKYVSESMSYYNNIKDIVSVAKNDKELANILNTFLKNFNIKTAIEQLKDSIEIPQNYEKYITKVTKLSMLMIKKVMESNLDDEKNQSKLSNIEENYKE